MRKLLLLLFLSASTFASAQLINIVELTDPTGSLRHVYEGSANGRFQYLSPGYTGNLDFQSHSNIQIIDDLLITFSDHPGVDVAAGYQMLPGFERNVDAYLSSIGSHGLWYNDLNRRVIIAPSAYLPPSEDPLQPLRSEWTPSHGESSWENIVCRNRYRISYNQSTGNFWVLWSEMNIDGEYEQRYGNGIVTPEQPHFTSADAAHSAVQAHIIATQPCAPLCTDTSIAHNYLDELVEAADSDFYTAGFTAWIDREGSENRWNRIEIGATQFVLEIGAGSEGHEGTRTSYDCLEELLLNLPN